MNYKKLKNTKLNETIYQRRKDGCIRKKSDKIGFFDEEKFCNNYTKNIINLTEA